MLLVHGDQMPLEVFEADEVHKNDTAYSLASVRYSPIGDVQK